MQRLFPAWLYSEGTGRYDPSSVAVMVALNRSPFTLGRTAHTPVRSSKSVPVSGPYPYATDPERAQSAAGPAAVAIRQASRR